MAASDFSEASLNTLQLALRTMKERCKGQEGRIGELEDDNSHLRADRCVGRGFSILSIRINPILSNILGHSG